MYKNRREFWMVLLSIALPIGIQSLLYSSLNIIDQIMVGQQGSVAIVAVGFASKNFGILNYILIGLSGGLAILSAQMIGNKQQGRIKKIQGMTFFAGLSIVIVFVIISLFFAESSMKVFTTDSNVISEGVKYHNAIAVGYIPFLITIVYSTILRTAKIVKLPMFINIASSLLNVLLNYVLIFGKFGFPAMGIQGAAIATTIARFFEAIVLLCFVYGRKLIGSFSLKELVEFFDFDGDIKLLWKLTLPLLATNISFIMADTVYSSIYGKMGTIQAVAITIMIPVQGMIISFFSGFSSATSIILGNSLGANKKDFAYKAAKKLITGGFIMPLICGIIVLLFIDEYINIFNLNISSVYIIKNLMIIMVVFLPFKIVNMILVQGVLASGGETKFLFYISVVGMWGIGVPLGLLVAYVYRLPIYWVYAAISFEELVRVFLGLHKVKSKKWLNNLLEEIKN